MPSVYKTVKYGRKSKYFFGATERKQSGNKQETIGRSPIDIA